MKKAVIRKRRNVYTWKWRLDFSDWVALTVIMATVDYVVWQLLRG